MPKQKSSRNKTALFIARFQPFHLGHYYAVRSILEKYRGVIIAIGSSQEDYTLRNPLTLEERVKIIKDALAEDRINRKLFKIVSIPDIPTNSIWPDYVRKKVGRFDEVVTASPFTKLLFEDKDYKVSEHSLVRRKALSGTNIREKMIKGRKWDNFVMSSTFVYLRKLGIGERLNRIIESDNPYV